MKAKQQRRSCFVRGSSLVAVFSIVVCSHTGPAYVSAISQYFPKDVSGYLFGEQCHSMWTTKNITKLKQTLDQNLFGQHIAIKLILSALRGRWNQGGCDTLSKKPLVLSFHGWTGSGKTYASKIIAEALFDRGLQSKFAHFFISTFISTTNPRLNNTEFNFKIVYGAM